jgi:YfiH family protein
MAFFEERVGSRVYIKNTRCDIPGLTCAFTTKPGGASAGEIYGLNLGPKTGDNPENIIENYKIVGRDLGINYEKIILPGQVHSPNVAAATPENAGSGVLRSSDFPNCDAVITNFPGIFLAVLAADCVPILIFDEKSRATCACHAGWRGARDRIAALSVRKLCETYGCNPENLVALIGPSICRDCFEVREETAREFDKKFVTRKDEKIYVDLQLANKEALINAGLKPENILIHEECTKENPEKFSSHRASGEKAGRTAAIIGFEREN